MTATANKTYTITKTKNGNERSATGTLAELTEYYSYTLMRGSESNPKISRTPKTIKGLISALNKSSNEIERGYSRTFYELG